MVPDTRGWDDSGRGRRRGGPGRRRPADGHPRHVDRDDLADGRHPLRTELEAVGIAADDALVHLVFAAVDGLVFQQVCLEDPAAARAGVERLRALLRPLAR